MQATIPVRPAGTLRMIAAGALLATSFVAGWGVARTFPDLAPAVAAPSIAVPMQGLSPDERDEVRANATAAPFGGLSPDERDEQDR